MTSERRFDVPLYTTTEAARLVGMSPSTLTKWAHGYRSPAAGGVSKHPPVISAIRSDEAGASIPFIGLVESTVVQAFRRSGLPMQRIRRALEALSAQGELDHALASKRLYTDGADVLFDYAEREGDKQLRLLTLAVVPTGQRVFHEVIEEYLSRITFGDTWATELIIPVTPRPILRARPDVAGGDPIFVNGGAPLSAVHDRAFAGESLASIARDFDLDVADVQEALDAIWPTQAAA